MRTRDGLLRRGTAHRGVLATAFVTVLLTLTVATAVALLQRSADEAAVTGVLTAAPPDERVVRVAAELEDDSDVAALDAQVRETLSASLATAEPLLGARTVSASYSLPGNAEDPDLTVFAAYGDDLADGATLVDGDWPEESRADGPVGVAVPRPAARRLDLSVGDRWTVRNRFTDEPVDVELTGVFVVDQPKTPAWLGDTLLLRGVQPGSFTTYGPLVVPSATFTGLFLDEATGTWTADPQLDEVRPDRLADLSAGVAAVQESLATEGLSVETDLPDVVDRVDTPLTASRATVVLGGAPLVLLAVAALLTAGRLLGDRRRVELALLRARGASTTQLGALALLEAVALTLPAVLLAPLLARLLVGTWGPDRVTGGSLPPAAAADWLLAAGAGVVAALVLVLPSWRREELTAAVRSAGAGRRAATRLGADLLVVVAAAVAAWQLARYDGPLRSGEPDPLLVAAPALLLLAGCLVTLRVLPVALAVVQPWAARSRGLTGALAAWTLSRQLGRQAGPVLAVLLSASVVAFSVTWLASWDRSARDRAEFTTGADVVVRDPGGALTAPALAALPGVRSVVPVARSTDSFGDARAELLALDTAGAADVVRLRGDLAERPFAALVAPLADAAAGARGGLPLPDGTAAVELAAPPARQVAVVQDGTGVLHSAPFEPRSGARLRAHVGALPAPVRLLGIQHRPGPTPLTDPRLRSVDEAGQRGPLVLPGDLTWRLREVTPGTRLLLAGSPRTGALPVLVTEGLADTVGDQDLVADANGLSLRLDVVGVVDGVPSVDPAEAEGVVLDLTTLNQAVLAQSGGLPTADPEWWLAAADPPAVAAAVTGLVADPEAVTAVDRESRLAALESGPVGTAVAGVLGVALVTALLTALSGVLASAAVLGPTRRREAALLRAIGAGPRQVSRLAALDGMGLLAVAGVAGVGVGLAVAGWTLPRIALSDEATAPYPPLLVEVPWLVLAAGTLVALGLGLLVQLWAPRRDRGDRTAGPARGEELP